MQPELKLDELLPPQTLEAIRQLFEATTGVPVAITDANGQPLTTIEKPLCFCGSLVSADGETLCLRRKKWDVPEPELEQTLRRQHDLQGVVQHKCRGGFLDTAVAIRVQDQTIGYAVFARTLDHQPDMNHFCTIATEAGMSPQVGRQVAQAALVMPRQRIEQIAGFLRLIAGLLASAAYDSIRAQRILELEELRDSLVHMIIHDLRTPLTGIISGLQTVIHADYDPEVTQELIPLSLSSADMLLELISTLLDVNKMESGQVELDLAPLEVDKVASAAVGLVEMLAREYGHQLSTDIAPNCPEIIADADKLQRVLVNLLGNAIKMTPSGGHIGLSADCDDQRLTLAVSDDGPGIPEEEHERIFDKFGQVRSRTEGRKYSTGLGLTFCRMVAEAHGGRIWVESQVGHGSTFYVQLPAIPADQGSV